MKNLKEARKRTGLLQKDVAEHLSVTRQTYGRYETGDIKPDPDTIIKLSKLFSVSSDYLLGLIELPFTSEEVKFMRKLYEEKDPKKIADEFEVYGEDPDKPVTMKDLKQIIDRLKELDREVHGDFFNKNK